MAMKIVRYVCGAMDIHKNIIVATVGITDRATNITTYHQETFSTLNSDLEKMKQWFLSYGCIDVCMESTGKYWIPVFNILESSIKVRLTHPKYVKAIKGKKTDKKDSKWICDLFKHDLIKFSFIPPKAIRELREIARYRKKLVEQRTSEKNRYQNCMTMSNIGLASVVSDPLGTTALKIMNEVIDSEEIDEDKIVKLIHKRCKNKDKIIDSLKGFNIESDQLFKMKECLQHIQYLDKAIEKCENELYIRSLPYADIIQNIITIKGITYLSAVLIIAEIGVDMNQFESSKQLTSWAGLSPANNESANKKKSVRISKAGQYLKPLLVQCALASIRDKDSYYGRKYLHLRAHRGHKKAIIAIARMMLTAIYHIISKGEEFNPCDLDEIMNLSQPNSFKEHKQALTVELAIQFLQESGINTSVLNLSP